MAQLRRDYSQFAERHTEVVVVGPESASVFSRYWKADMSDIPSNAEALALIDEVNA